MNHYIGFKINLKKNGQTYRIEMPERFKVTKAPVDQHPVPEVQDEEAALGKLLQDKQGEFEAPTY